MVSGVLMAWLRPIGDRVGLTLLRGRWWPRSASRSASGGAAGDGDDGGALRADLYDAGYGLRATRRCTCRLDDVVVERVDGDGGRGLPRRQGHDRVDRVVVGARATRCPPRSSSTWVTGAVPGRR